MMDRKKIVIAAAAVVVIIVLVIALGRVWVLGAGTKNALCMGPGRDPIESIPIALITLFYLDGDFPAEAEQMCTGEVAGYVPCVNALLAPKMGGSSPDPMVEEINAKCPAAQEKIESLTAGVCAANEIIVGINEIPMLFLPPPEECVDVFCSGEGRSLNLFGEIETTEALRECFEAMTEYYEAQNP